MFSSGHEPGTHGPAHCPTRKTVIFGFSIGLPACQMRALDHPRRSEIPLFGGFHPPGRSKYPHFGGFETPFGTLHGGALTETAKWVVWRPEGPEIGAIDGDFPPENPVFLGGCHPEMARSEVGPGNWCYRSGFRTRKIGLLDTVSP